MVLGRLGTVGFTWISKGHVVAMAAMLTVAAAGCAAGAPVGQDALEDSSVVIPGKDAHADTVGRDIVDAIDAAVDVPDDNLRDVVIPADLPAEFGYGDVVPPQDVLVSDGLDLGDPASLDVTVADLPGENPVASDAGHELIPSSCKPGQTTCWCVDETQCNQEYSKTCQPSRCNPKTGHCVLDSGFLNGQECEDGDACTTGEICQLGLCKGGTFTCECRLDSECPDTDPCTDDRCIDGYCQHPFNTTPCEDGDACTSGDACLEGVCTAGAFVCECRLDGDCGDPDPCTDDRCIDGYCQYPFNTAPCEDGDGCTSGDACLEGACIPGSRICQCDSDLRCDDGVTCTDDRCVEGNCTNTLVAGTCRVAGECIAEGTTNPSNACLACDPSVATDAWSNLVDGAPCEDGDTCTSLDTCASGSCVPGTRVCECMNETFCNDDIFCTDDTCVDSICIHEPNVLPCDDGDPLTVGDRCGGGNCVPGSTCGDATCLLPYETCKTCSTDCGICPETETACADGWDDDQDGFTDCEDPDCQPTPACTSDG